jgi:DNA-binding transcriptional LysR family regulator
MISKSPSSLLLISDQEPEYPDFRQLSYFVSVAEELHFGRAAVRLFISQPALSQAIAGLERALGVQLLVRSRQSVELTEAGAELLDRARGLLADREEAVDGVRRVARGEAGVLRVGVALFADQDVGGVLASFAEDHPGVFLDRFGAVSERLLAAVRDHSLEVAFVHQVPVLATLEGVEWEVFRQAGLAVAVGHASPFAGRDSVALSELSEETFLAIPRELAPSAFEGLVTAFHTYGGFVPKLVESPTWALGQDWRPIVAGEAVALLPESAGRALHPDGTAVIPVEEPQATIAVAWRRGHRSPIVARFLDFVRAGRG